MSSCAAEFFGDLIHQQQGKVSSHSWMGELYVLQKMKYITALLIFPLFSFLIGCGEPKADLSAPKKYSKGGITFSYPKNWKVSEEIYTPDVHYVSVETPAEAIVILQSYSIDIADEFSDYSKTFSADASGELTIGKIATTKLVELPQAKGYEWISEGFCISLLGESIPHKRLYGCKDVGDRRLFLIFQVSDEDAVNVQSGFELIRDSLRITNKQNKTLHDG
jgi:hypothetical protein